MKSLRWKTLLKRCRVSLRNNSTTKIQRNWRMRRGERIGKNSCLNSRQKWTRNLQRSKWKNLYFAFIHIFSIEIHKLAHRCLWNDLTCFNRGLLNSFELISARFPHKERTCALQFEHLTRYFPRPAPIRASHHLPRNPKARNLQA